MHCDSDTPAWCGEKGSKFVLIDHVAFVVVVLEFFPSSFLMHHAFCRGDGSKSGLINYVAFVGVVLDLSEEQVMSMM